MKTKSSNFLNLAFNIAKINLGKTGKNPSVGCVVVKDNSVISSGITSINGRPHAEFNALSYKKNFKNAHMYVTMEPCVHYGVTPPCTNIIIRKGIKKVFFSNYDFDKRTFKKSTINLKKRGVIAQKKTIQKYKNFYKSYYLFKKKALPLIDAKIAVSKDFYTIKKKSKWITSELSRKKAHLIRSNYDCIISTSKSINKDNSLLNCRINGFNKNKPDLIIIDTNNKIKKKLKLFNNKKRKIFIVTKREKLKKDVFFIKKKINQILINSLVNKKDLIDLFKLIKKKGYSRVLIECGLTFLNKLIINKLVNNLYIFQSAEKLLNNGKNNASNSYLKNIKLRNKINVYLGNDSLYKIRIK